MDIELEEEKESKMLQVKMASVNAIAISELTNLGIKHTLNGIYIEVELPKGKLTLRVIPEDSPDTIRQRIRETVPKFWDNWKEMDWWYIVFTSELRNMWEEYLVSIGEEL